MKTLLVAIMLLTTLVGCKPDLKKHVDLGMTREQIRTKLGKPDKIGETCVNPGQRGGKCTIKWVYGDDFILFELPPDALSKFATKIVVGWDF